MRGESEAGDFPLPDDVAEHSGVSVDEITDVCDHCVLSLQPTAISDGNGGEAGIGVMLPQTTVSESTSAACAVNVWGAQQRSMS